MAQKPFATLDLTNDYIVHDVTLYAHDHPTQPDGINAAVKSIETALQAFDLDDYEFGGDAVGGYVAVSASRALLSSELQGHLVIVTGSSAVTLTLPAVSTLSANARVDVIVLSDIDVYLTPDAGDRIVFNYTALADGASIDNDEARGAITFRRDVDGWIVTSSTNNWTSGVA